MVEHFIQNIKSITPTRQHGEVSYYKRRSKSSSELNPNLSIKDQFNLLRVVDNERYPAFFFLNGQKYIIKIFKDDA
jgi:methionyl-tRNA formyltransferase